MFEYPGLFRPLILPLAAMAVSLASAAGAGSVLPGFATEGPGIGSALAEASDPLLNLGSELLSAPMGDLMTEIAPQPLFGPAMSERTVSQSAPLPLFSEGEPRRD